jgi:hypothetical protein
MGTQYKVHEVNTYIVTHIYIYVCLFVCLFICVCVRVQSKHVPLSSYSQFHLQN